MGSHNVVQGVWQWLDNVADDGSKTGYAGEDTEYTLTGSETPDSIIMRLRVQLVETGGKADTGIDVDVQYSEDSTNWLSVAAQGSSNALWVSYANGANTDDTTIGSQLLTGSDASGQYHETSAVTEDVGADAIHEIDVALLIRWPPPDTDLKFRILYDGGAINLDAGAVEIALQTWTPVNRSADTVGRLDYNTTDGSDPTGFFGGKDQLYWDENNSYWWLFVADENGDQLNYWYWDGSGNWSSRQTLAMTGNAQLGRMAVHLADISGNTVVMLAWENFDATIRYRRGTISSTTITWGTDTQLLASDTGNRYDVTLDDSNYWWIVSNDHSTGVWAKRSTNADAGSSWSSGWNSTHTLADSGAAADDPILAEAFVYSATDKILVVWPSGGGLEWAECDEATGFGSATTLVATSNDDDFGMARGGGYIYLVHTDNAGAGGNWVLRVFTESSESWATGTSPSVTGQPSAADRIHVTYYDDGIFASGTFTGTEPIDRVISYKYYDGPGASGTWDAGLTEISEADRGNGDEHTGAPVTANGKYMVVWSLGDPSASWFSRAIEAFYDTVASTTTDSVDADATIEAEVTGSVTADAIIESEQTGSVTADATIQIAAEEKTGSVTGDATIQAEQTGSVTGDATIQSEQTGSVTGDAIIERTEPGSITADAIIERTESGSVTGDATIFREQTGSVASDATIQAEQTGSVTADAVVERTETGSVTADAIIERTESGSVDADAIIGRTESDSVTADSTILAEQTDSVTGDATIEAEQVDSVTADAFIAGAQGGTISADAVIESEQTGSITADASIVYARSGSVDADATIKSEQTGGVTADSIIKAEQTSSVTSDAVIFGAQAGSVTADAVIERTEAGSVTTDAIVQRTETDSVAADATIETEQTDSVTADAYIAGAGGGTVTADAVIQAEQIGSVTADANIIVTGTTIDSITADAVIQRSEAGSVTSDAIIEITATGSVTADSAIQAEQTGSVTADSAIQAEQTGSVTADANIVYTTSDTVTADATVQVEQTGSVTADATIIPLVEVAAFGTVSSPGKTGIVTRPTRTGTVTRPNRAGNEVIADRQGD